MLSFYLKTIGLFYFCVFKTANKKLFFIEAKLTFETTKIGHLELIFYFPSCFSQILHSFSSKTHHWRLFGGLLFTPAVIKEQGTREAEAVLICRGPQSSAPALPDSGCALLNRTRGVWASSPLPLAKALKGLRGHVRSNATNFTCFHRPTYEET